MITRKSAASGRILPPVHILCQNKVRKVRGLWPFWDKRKLQTDRIMIMTIIIMKIIRKASVVYSGVISY